MHDRPLIACHINKLISIVFQCICKNILRELLIRQQNETWRAINQTKNQNVKAVSAGLWNMQWTVWIACILYMYFIYLLTHAYSWDFFRILLCHPICRLIPEKASFLPGCCVASALTHCCHSDRQPQVPLVVETERKSKVYNLFLCAEQLMRCPAAGIVRR